LYLDFPDKPRYIPFQLSILYHSCYDMCLYLQCNEVTYINKQVITKAWQRRRSNQLGAHLRTPNHPFDTPRVPSNEYASLQHRHRLEGSGDTVREGWERAHAYTCDVTDRYQVAETAQRVLKDFGRVDILVNNAPNTAAPHERPAEVVVGIVSENLLSHFWVSCKFVDSNSCGVRNRRASFQIR